jgi:restriction endonuclease S subunit
LKSPFDERKYKRLLKGLEVSEVRLSESIKNKDFRMDSDFWTKQPKKNPNLKYMKIGDILQSSQYGISVSMNEDAKGYPIYRMNEIHNMLCDLSVDKYADISVEELQKFILKNRDVLFNRTNSFEWVGRTGVYYQNDTMQNTFASYLVCFNPNEDMILPEYLVAFLNSKQGVWDVKRRARQSINQTNVNPEEVKEIEIPLLPMNFQKVIRSRFEKANKNRILSRQIYQQAEELLLKNIGLSNFNSSKKVTNIKSFKESFLKTGRLDAEYYQRKHEEIENKIRKSKNGFSTIRKEFRQNKTIIDTSEKQYNYIEIGDIDVGNGSYGFNLIDVTELPANAKIKSKKGNLLISKVRPNRGAVTIINENIPNLVVSGAFTVLEEKANYKKEVLFVLLRTPYYKEWLLKYNVGTSYPVIKDEDVLNLPIPLIGDGIQQKIVNFIEESFLLRRKSEKLLEEAKTLVEMEIGG